MSKAHHTDYDDARTDRCEQALVTLLGDLGPWKERVYLAGGLAPRYIVGALPEGARVHVGSADVDLVIGLELGEETPEAEEAYRTLQSNLERAQFERGDLSFRWGRSVDGTIVIVEFLCETSEVAWGRISSPKGAQTGSKLGALNIRGAGLVSEDFIERELECQRLDGGGISRVTVRVANLLPYAVLKMLAFQDRHENKDAYDLIFTLLNTEEGPSAAGAIAASSPVAGHPLVTEALDLLAQRFVDVDQDGPSAYSLFLGYTDDEDARARLRREAVATVREFLDGFHAER